MAWAYELPCKHGQNLLAHSLGNLSRCSTLFVKEHKTKSKVRKSHLEKKILSLLSNVSREEDLLFYHIVHRFSIP
jgi:hypothetical protein